jgi:hypothetical protein
VHMCTSPTPAQSQTCLGGVSPGKDAVASPRGVHLPPPRDIKHNALHSQVYGLGRVRRIEFLQLGQREHPIAVGNGATVVASSRLSLRLV